MMVQEALVIVLAYSCYFLSEGLECASCLLCTLPWLQQMHPLKVLSCLSAYFGLARLEPAVGLLAILCTYIAS
jgi:hypothetical protein